MTSTKAFTIEDARRIGTEIGIDWEHLAVRCRPVSLGLEVELEHGAQDPETNVTDDDDLTTGKIAWAHLKELPDYYTRLAVMETAAGS